MWGYSCSIILYLVRPGGARDAFDWATKAKTKILGILCPHALLLVIGERRKRVKKKKKKFKVFLSLSVTPILWNLYFLIGSSVMEFTHKKKKVEWKTKSILLSCTHSKTKLLVLFWCTLKFSDCLIWYMSLLKFSSLNMLKIFDS